ncbi:hypothetical protein TrVGV298_001089 [Trichoderma virens]|nr:hypothetical protein TrVGV298_001089 [Trichoderma virens]
MASHICWNRANLNSSHPNYGILALRKRLASPCSSSFNWSIIKTRAAIGKLGASNVSNGSSPQPAVARSFSSPTTARAKRQKPDRDVIVSVLESSATRRDAKGYLQKYAQPNPTPQLEHRNKLNISTSPPRRSFKLNFPSM